jgi:hypothetical protein
MCDVEFERRILALLNLFTPKTIKKNASQKGFEFLNKKP